MEAHTELIADLRQQFFKQLDEEGAPDSKGFHPADIEKIKANDDWLKRFLEHHENNLQEAFKMLWDTCSWRKKFGTNEITENTVRRDYLEEGVVFSHGKDKDGKKLFIIKSKLHVKGSRDFTEFQRCVVYWFERLERETNGDQISIFFDMVDSGLSNVDMEFTNFTINLFKYYYPNFLNYIIILDMPWIMNAAFKIIKSWLPAKAIPKIKFVNKSNLKEYVHPNEALKCWGGNNEYVFTFVPEILPNSDSMVDGKVENKKVHFAESSPMTEQTSAGFNEMNGEDRLLSVEHDAITFNKEGDEIIGIINLKNISLDKPISFKVKTTSPEKFKVKPSSGILSPLEKKTVTVVLQTGYTVRGFLHNDRFLVMCLPVKSPNITTKDLAALWKNEKPVEQHRLSCYDGTIDVTDQKVHSYSVSGSAGSERATDALLNKITRLEDHCHKLSMQLVTLKYLILLSLILTALMASAFCHIHFMKEF